jgi:pilus assembly protein CpaB
MDRRFLTVLAVSLVFALVVSSVFYQMTSSAGGDAPSAADEVDVIVAARPLGVGVLITPADVKLAKLPAAAFPTGAYSKVEEVLDRPVVSNILIDEPILEGRLALKGSGLGLAPTIPVGMRGVSVRVNDVAGVAGYVLPGMRVDVLVTGRPPAEDDTMTNTVLQNLLVLSAGTQMQTDARGQPIPTPNVTLLATPEQAEVLTLANSEGRIQLILRNSSDQDMSETTGSFVSELYSGRRKAVAQAPPPAPRPRPVAPPPAPVAVAAPPPPPPPPAPAPPPEVVTIRGTQRSVEVVAKPANE